MTDKIQPADAAGAVLFGHNSGAAPGAQHEGGRVKGAYEIICRGADGVEKWRETIDNLVVNVGKAYVLDNALAGAAFTAAYFMGFVDGASTPTYNAADTMSSHSGWSENSSYSSSTRPAVSWNAASAGTKTTTATAFSITGSATIAGVFLTTSSTKGGTSGILISAGSFSGGNRTVSSGDSLSVTYSMSI